MALVEAVLTYRPNGIGSEETVPIGKTSDPGVLRALRDCLLEQAFRDARAWRKVDPGVAAMRAAEAQRLARILKFLLPDEDLKPELRVVEEDE